MSMNDYLLKVRHCVDFLGLVGHNLTEKEHIDAILNGLSAQYDVFVLSIGTHLDPYTVDDIESSSLAQEARFDKNLKELDLVQSGSALLVITRGFVDIFLLLADLVTSFQHTIHSPIMLVVVVISLNLLEVMVFLGGGSFSGKRGSSSHPTKLQCLCRKIGHVVME